MDFEIHLAQILLKRWQSEKNAFEKQHEHYEPKGDVSHIWANLTQVFEIIDEILEDFGDE